VWEFLPCYILTYITNYKSWSSPPSCPATDGWVIDGMDGLGLGQVLVDGPEDRDGDSKILDDGGTRRRYRRVCGCWMGLREGQEQQRRGRI